MSINYSELETGDVLLFYYKSNCKSLFNCGLSCFSDLIMCCTDSKYSHCAIVVRNPGDKVGLYILQSSFELFPDAEDHKYKFGVELEDFYKVINSFTGHPDNDYGTIYCRKLNCTRNKEFYKKYESIQTFIHDKPYDCLPDDWINAILQKYNKSDAQVTNRFWCSALVAYLYVNWGFLPEDTPWTLITPKMFGTESTFKSSYKLQFQNCSLGKEIKIS